MVSKLRRLNDDYFFFSNIKGVEIGFFFIFGFRKIKELDMFKIKLFEKSFKKLFFEKNDN